MNIPFENIVDIDCIKFTNIGFDKLYPIVLTLNDAVYGYNSLWYASLSLSMIIRIHKFMNKPLPEYLVFDHKTMNYINRFNLEDCNNIVYGACSFLSSL
jgi:hypothetical protein